MFVSSDEIKNTSFKKELDKRCSLAKSEQALELTVITPWSNFKQGFRNETNFNRSSFYFDWIQKNVGRLTLHESFVPGTLCSIALVHECTHENHDVWAHFMKPDGLLLYWFENGHRNQCWVPLQHIICNVKVPFPHGSSCRKYTSPCNIKTLLPENSVWLKPLPWSKLYHMIQRQKHLQIAFVWLCFLL